MKMERDETKIRHRSGVIPFTPLLSMAALRLTAMAVISPQFMCVCIFVFFADGVEC